MCLKHRSRKRVQQLNTVSVKLPLRDERTEDRQSRSDGRTDLRFFVSPSEFEPKRV